jgi:dipeptidyl aminopeptidase/acylaminoacyl peptidase
LCLLAALSGACAQRLPAAAQPRTVQVTLTADNQSHTLATEATNVRELLEEVEVSVAPLDMVEPPLHTPLTDGLAITIVRVTESVEVVRQVIPFERRIVRNNTMSADDPPLIVQSGRPGVEELTVRIIFHDGQEVERRYTAAMVVEAAQDEILMVGVGAAGGDVAFSGLLAYVSGGNALLLRGDSAFPEPINTGINLDHRVFRLSPTGSHLLYTLAGGGARSFNSLWLVALVPGARPVALGIDNVLWADWNPAEIERQQFAYSTGKPTELLPGWEANNDLWIAELAEDEDAPIATEQLVEAYPATYGWWGGSYSWSPAGRYIAFAYADEIGVIDIQATREADRRRRLFDFVEYNTRSDWVWLPTLTWSPDGRSLAFTAHEGAATTAARFATWAVDVGSGAVGRLVEGAGMWTHPQWSPFAVAAAEAGSAKRPSRIAFLLPTEPLDSQRSSYTLWLMDRDGSNERQLYPPVGESSRFAHEEQYMAWSPDGQMMAFIYNDGLYIFDLTTGVAHLVTQDDASARNPTWAPYGAGLLAALATPAATATPNPISDPLLEE